MRGSGIRSLESWRLKSFVNREERLVEELVSLACSTATIALEVSVAVSRFLSVGEERTSGWGRGVDAQPELSATAVSKEKPRKERMRTASLWCLAGSPPLSIDSMKQTTGED